MNSRPNGLTISILVDNKADGGLRAEHGFAAWVEVAGKRLVFDTGQGPALGANAPMLGIDLGATDVLVLSHGHYDHTGGVPLIVDHAPGVRIYVHPAATGARYAIRNGTARTIAMSQAAKDALDKVPKRNLHWTTEPIEIADGAGLTGPIPRDTDYENTGGPFFVDGAGTAADPITDDLALWARTDRGLVVVIGCGHAGLINTLRHALRVSKESRLHAVVGGFHLGEASGQRLERTVEELGQLAPDLIVPCHCTGEAAVERLRLAFGDRVVPGAAGARYSFEQVRPC